MMNVLLTNIPYRRYANCERANEAVTDKTGSIPARYTAPIPSGEVAAKEELDLLAKLISGGGGGEEAQKGKDTFRLSIFEGKEEDFSMDDGSRAAKSAQSETLQINLKTSSKKASSELASIMDEMKMGEDAEEVEKGDDLLSLMDQAK